MLVYNITLKIEHSIHQSWLNWMKTTHISEMMATGRFTSYRFLKILDYDEAEGITYALQFYLENRSAYDSYLSTEAPELRRKTWKNWGEKVVSFRTLMESVN